MGTDDDIGVETHVNVDMHASEIAILAIDVDVSGSVPTHPCDVSESEKEMNVPVSDNINQVAEGVATQESTQVH